MIQSPNAEPKVCPLLSIFFPNKSAIVGANNAVGQLMVRCIERQCAWWCAADKECAVVSGAGWTKRLAAGELLKKDPAA